MKHQKPIPEHINIAPRGMSWLDGKLVEGEHGYPTFEEMQKQGDRLERFKNSIQWRLERDIGRVGELVQWCKMWPDNAESEKAELTSIEEGIPVLRAILENVKAFEADDEYEKESLRLASSRSLD